MARRKKLVYSNRRKRKFYFSVLLVCLFMLGLGYANIATHLAMNGTLSIDRYDHTLYGVLRKAARKGTYAREYTGEHQDSWSGDGTEKIYHWYASDDNTVDAILNMNNVIFAGHCWQMLRTTDTGGVKMIYNGEVEDGKCLTTRGTHVGYSERITINVYNNYYYGTSYEYDSVNQLFSLAGDLFSERWSDSTYQSLIGKYTCLHSNPNGTCSILYFIQSYNSNREAKVLPITSTSTYSHFGFLQYNPSSNSIADVGYMYNTRYSIANKALYESYSLGTIDVNWYYADSIDYGTITPNQYTLINPISVSTLSDYSELIGKYVMNGTASGTNCYYGIALSGEKLRYKELKNGDVNIYVTVGDSYTESGGIYHLESSETANYTDLFGENYSSYVGKYLCDGIHTDCSDIRHITYINTTDNNYYYWSPSLTCSFSEDVSYNGATGVYTLTGDIQTFWDFSANSEIIKSHHYTCVNSGLTCSTVGYVTFLSIDLHYTQLSGVANMEAAIQEMLYANNVNTTNSIIKTAVEAWYAKYLKDYDDYIEDTIFCNDRTIKNLGTFGANGNSLGQLNFKMSSSDLSCDHVTDQFSTLNSNAPLAYKVGLMTYSEMKISNKTIARAATSNRAYWLLSPMSFRLNMSVHAENSNITVTGGTLTGSGAYMYANNGVRPAISLIPGAKYSLGDGSMENPYVVADVLNLEADRNGNITAHLLNASQGISSILYSLDQVSWQEENTFIFSNNGDYTVYAKLIYPSGKYVIISNTAHVSLRKLVTYKVGYKTINAYEVEPNSSYTPINRYIQSYVKARDRVSYGLTAGNNDIYYFYNSNLTSPVDSSTITVTDDIILYSTMTKQVPRNTQNPTLFSVQEINDYGLTYVGSTLNWGSTFTNVVLSDGTNYYLDTTNSSSFDYDSIGTLDITFFDGESNVVYRYYLNSCGDSECYRYDGEYTFDGTNYIDTGVSLFSNDNWSRNFYMEFEVVEDTSTDLMATSMSAKNESGTPWPGVELRHANSSTILRSKATKSGSSSNEITDIPIATRKYKYLRINNVLYYSFDSATFTEMLDFAGFTLQFDIPVTFGASLTGVNGSPQRYFKGKLANMEVKFISSSATISDYEG